MMTKTNNAQLAILAPGKQADIPESVDSFLRMLARWAVKEMRYEPAFQAEDMSAPVESAEIDETRHTVSHDDINVPAVLPLTSRPVEIF